MSFVLGYTLGLHEAESRRNMESMAESFSKILANRQQAQQPYQMTEWEHYYYSLAVQLQQDLIDSQDLVEQWKQYAGKVQETLDEANAHISALYKELEEERNKSCDSSLSPSF